MAKPREPEGFTAEEQALFEKLNIGKEGGVPLPSFIKPSEVVEQSKPLSESIFGDWSALKHIVERYERLLFERWKNLKKKKRKDMLLEAWTDMPQSHRPDLAIWREREQSGGFHWAEKDREAFMWPQINIEDLCKARPLWLLMKSRGRSPPDTFAAADLDTTRFGKACLALTPRYLNQYSMLFTGRTTPDTYGQLYAWNELLSTDSSLFENRGTHPGEGLWILIIQARLYRFLRGIASKILGAMSTSEDLLKGPVRDEPDNSFGRPDADFDEQAISFFEAPYLRPGQMMLQRLLDYTCAKLWEAENHLWALCEDPAYFATVLNEWREHRREMMTDVNGEPHSAFKTPEVLWSRVMNGCIRRALEQIETWNIVYAKVHLVAQQMEKHAKGIKSDALLPRDLALALYSLLQYLKNFESEPVGNLRIGAFASPPLRQYFRILPTTDPKDTSISLTTAEEAPEDSATGDAVWILGKLQDNNQRRLLGTQALLDQLEYRIQEDKSVREAVSPWVADQIAALALYSSCIREIEHFQPWAAKFEVEMQDKEISSILGMDFHMSMQRIRPLLEHNLSDRVVALGIPEDGRFEYPLDRATPENLEKMQRAEKALDAFWAKLWQNLDKHKAITPRIKEVLSNMPIQRTAALNESTPKAASARTQQGKKKKKKVKVDKRSMKVFRTLFYDPTVESSMSSTPAEIVWLDLVHAMHVAGFDVLKMYGSAWLFVPRGSDLQGNHPSMFREPWTSSNKVHPTAARWIGKRLTRAYGWNKGTFEAE